MTKIRVDDARGGITTLLHSHTLIQQRRIDHSNERDHTATYASTFEFPIEPTLRFLLENKFSLILARCLPNNLYMYVREKQSSIRYEAQTTKLKLNSI